MASPSIVWRNPKPVKRMRTWTQVRRGEQRSLYLVLESKACGPTAWEGLPTLEVVRGRASQHAASNDPRPQSAKSTA